MADVINLAPLDPEFNDAVGSINKAETETPPVYLSEWLAQHPAAKPPLEFHQVTAAQGYTMMSVMINAGTWSDLTVTGYMRAVIAENLPQFTARPTERWESCGRVICEAGVDCTPFNLLQMTEVVPDDIPAGPDGNARGGNIRDRLSRLFGLLMIYRKTLAKDTERANGIEVARKMNELFQAGKIGTASRDITDFDTYYVMDRLTPNYVALIAAIDMFFFKFPKAELAAIRMATMPTRYRGCVVVTSIDSTSRACGLTPAELCRFSLTNAVARDIMRVAKTGQYAEDIHGHFPYQLCLGLTPKTAYSLSENPTLHLWLHTIGCLFSIRRSMNAIMPDDAVDIPETIVFAIAFALKGRGGELKLQFGKDAAEREILRERERLQADHKRAWDEVDRHNQRLRNAAAVAAGRAPRDEAERGGGVEAAEGAENAEEEDEKISDEEIEGLREYPEEPRLPALPESTVTTAVQALVDQLTVNNGLSEEQLTSARARVRTIPELPNTTVGHYIKQYITAMRA